MVLPIDDAGGNMAIQHRIEKNFRVVLFIHTGVVEDAEFVDYYRTFFQQSAVELSFDRIIDLQQADSSVRSVDALQQVVEIMEAAYEDAAPIPKTAVIAPEDVSFGLGRMFQAFDSLGPGQFSVFRTLEDALNWLELPVDSIPENSK